MNQSISEQIKKEAERYSTIPRNLNVNEQPIYQAGIRHGFLAGASFRESLAGKEGVARWRNADDKPTELLKSYYCKVYLNLFEKYVKRMVLITLDGQWQDNVVEWLDESPMKSEGAEEYGEYALTAKIMDDYDKGKKPSEESATGMREALEIILANPFDVHLIEQTARKALSPSPLNECKWSDSDVKKFLEDYRVANREIYLNPVIWFDKLNDEK